MSGEDAWNTIKERALALEDAVNRLPSWQFEGLLTALTAILKIIAARQDELSGVYKADPAQRFKDLVASVDAILIAGVWVQAQYERSIAPERSIKVIAERVYALRTAAMNGLDTLESLSLVSSKEASVIRQGQGYTDASGDIQALAPMLRERWFILEPLQVHIQDPRRRLTTEKIDAMPAAALDLLNADRQRQSPSDVDWYDALRRLTVLLEKDWDVLRTLYAGALSALGEQDAALPVQPSVLSLYRKS